jgi:hypothetical protein
MTLTTFGMIARDEPDPLLGGEEGGALDQLRVVHDVFGHVALGLGFDLQSEFATWLQCQTLFSDDARPAAFCKLVGAVTTYVMTGEKPALHADLPPRELVAACDVDATPTAAVLGVSEASTRQLVTPARSHLGSHAKAIALEGSRLAAPNCAACRPVRTGWRC